MGKVCRLELEINNELIKSDKDYAIINNLNKLLNIYLFKNSDGLWYSKDSQLTHERIFGTLTALSRTTVV